MGSLRTHEAHGNVDVAAPAREPTETVSVHAPANKRATARIPLETYKKMVEFYRRETGATNR